MEFPQNPSGVTPDYRRKHQVLCCGHALREEAYRDIALYIPCTVTLLLKLHPGAKFFEIVDFHGCLEIGSVAVWGVELLHHPAPQPHVQFRGGFLGVPYSFVLQENELSLGRNL